MDDKQTTNLRNKLEYFFRQAVTGKVDPEYLFDLHQEFAEDLSYALDDAQRKEALDIRDRKRSDLLDLLQAHTAQYLDGELDLNMFLMRVSALAATSREI